MVLRRRAHHIHGRALRAAGAILAAGGLASLGLAALLAGTGSPAGASAASSTGFGDPTGQPLAYVTASGKSAVVVIETQPLAEPKVLGTIPVQAAPTTCAPRVSYVAAVGAPCSSHPVGITASPTGQWLYVDASASGGTNQAGTPMGAIDVISVATDTVVKVFPTGSTPVSSAVSPSGTTLYVAAQGEATASSGVLDVIHVNGSSLSGETAVPLPEYHFVATTAPEVVAVGDKGARVAVADTVDGVGYLDIFTVNPVTGTVTGGAPVRTLRFQDLATSVAVGPATTKVAYAVQEATTKAGRGPVDTHAVTVVTLVTFTTVATTPPKVVELATGFATAIAASPSGTTLAVALASLTTGTDPAVAPLTITKTKPFTPTPDTPVSLGPTAGPTALQFLPSGTGLYAVDETATSVSVLDTITTVTATVDLSTTTTLGTGTKPLAVAFGHVTPPAATTTTTTTTVPTTVTVPVKTSGGSSTSIPPPATSATAATGGPQLAYTGSTVEPWLWLGASLAVTGALLLVADVRLRRRPRHTPPPR